ncbi:MAG: extracellular solute-binding protein [Jatrophihabitans sp.]|uniref:extracellular solute-binding protein n=1 Tax=Jatrophihabitans sp. TaxID=1932789 RepID=UPI003F7F6E56
MADVHGAAQAGMSRRSFLAGVAGVGALTALSACSSSSSASAGGRKKLTYWTWASSSAPDPRSQAQKQILARFRQTHPSVDVVEQVVPFADLSNQLIQSVQTGRAPDVSRQVDSNLGTLVAAGAIAPLDQYVSGWNSAQKSQFLYPWNDTVVNGKKYAFRQALRPSNYTYYRTDLYQKAGLTVPTTGTAFRADIQKLTSGSEYGWLIALSKSDALSAIMQILPPILWDMGSDLIDPSTSAPIFQHEAGATVLAWMQDLVRSKHVMPSAASTMDTNAADQQFLAGKVSTYFANTAKYASWSSTASFPAASLGYAPFPNFGDNATKPGSANLGGGWTLTMSKTADQDLAWEFIDFMHSAEAELIDAQVGGELPTNSQTLEQAWFKTPAAKYIHDAFTWLQQSSHEATTLKIKNYPAFVDAFGNAVQAIITNGASVTSTLNDAARTYSGSL